MREDPSRGALTGPAASRSAPVWPLSRSSQEKPNAFHNIFASNQPLLRKFFSSFSICQIPTQSLSASVVGLVDPIPFPLTVVKYFFAFSITNSCVFVSTKHQSQSISFQHCFSPFQHESERHSSFFGRNNIITLRQFLSTITELFPSVPTFFIPPGGIRIEQHPGGGPRPVPQVQIRILSAVTTLFASPFYTAPAH